MIIGNNEPINSNSMAQLPNCADVIESWASEYTALLITKTMKDFVLTETTKEITFQGMIQNLNRKELEIKPEGERNWGWYKLHSTRQFNNDDIIEVLGIRYKIMSTRQDNTYYGFFAYDLIQDYDGEESGTI